MYKTFWEAALIRAVKTICQTAIATIGTAMVITEVDWKYVLSASLLAGILSILTSIAMGLPEVDEDIDVFEDDDIEVLEDDEPDAEEIDIRDGDEDDE
jgi:hypothetical protein